MSKDTPGVPTKTRKVRRGPVKSHRHCVVAGNPKHFVSKLITKKNAVLLLIKDDEKTWANPTQRMMLLKIAGKDYKSLWGNKAKQSRKAKTVDPFIKLPIESRSDFIKRIQEYIIRGLCLNDKL